MSHEIIYTSAVRGLKPGAYGFCTVAMTAGAPSQLVEKLESLSGYRHIFPPDGSTDAKNPAVRSHLALKMGGQRLHVLSKISDAGLDYSHRSNKLAHHVVLSGSELVAAGPAWVLQQPGFSEVAWSGEPRLIPVGRCPPAGLCPPRSCELWRQTTGDAGWAGVLAQNAAGGGRPALLIVPTSLDPLPLLVEALALLPERDRWKVTFSTYFTRLPSGVDCQWRCVVAGTPEAQEAANARGELVIDLTKTLGVAPPGPLVEASRSGQMLVDHPVGDSQNYALPGRRPQPTAFETGNEDLSSTTPIQRIGTGAVISPVTSTSIDLAPPVLPPPVANAKRGNRGLPPQIPTSKQNSRSRWVLLAIGLSLASIAAVIAAVFYNADRSEALVQALSPHATTSRVNEQAAISYEPNPQPAIPAAAAQQDASPTKPSELQQLSKTAGASPDQGVPVSPPVTDSKPIQSSTSDTEPGPKDSSNTPKKESPKEIVEKNSDSPAPPTKPSIPSRLEALQPLPKPPFTRTAALSMFGSSPSKEQVRLFEHSCIEELAELTLVGGESTGPRGLKLSLASDNSRKKWNLRAKWDAMSKPTEHDLATLECDPSRRDGLLFSWNVNLSKVADSEGSIAIAMDAVKCCCITASFKQSSQSSLLHFAPNSVKVDLNSPKATPTALWSKAGWDRLVPPEHVFPSGLFARAQLLGTEEYLTESTSFDFASDRHRQDFRSTCGEIRFIVKFNSEKSNVAFSVERADEDPKSIDPRLRKLSELLFNRSTDFRMYPARSVDGLPRLPKFEKFEKFVARLDEQRKDQRRIVDEWDAKLSADKRFSMDEMAKEWRKQCKGLIEDLSMFQSTIERMKNSPPRLNVQLWRDVDGKQWPIGKVLEPNPESESNSK